MMYIRDLAAIAGLTLVVVDSLPLTARRTGKTLPGALCQTDYTPRPVGRESYGRILTERAPAPHGLSTREAATRHHKGY
jgi:hypothetical protein